MGQGDVEKFITGSVGYVKVISGQVASFDGGVSQKGREMNAILAVGDTIVEVVQYENFYSGTEAIADGIVLFGKFKQVSVTSGEARIYSSGGAPTIV